jgi:hypothetical protein
MPATAAASALIWRRGVRWQCQSARQHDGRQPSGIFVMIGISSTTVALTSDISSNCAEPNSFT